MAVGATFKKIPIVEYYETRREWDSGPKHQRLGQWFLNTFFPLLIDGKLFYEKDVEKCEKIIFEKYVIV